MGRHALFNVCFCFNLDHPRYTLFPRASEPLLSELTCLFAGLLDTFLFPRSLLACMFNSAQPLQCVADERGIVTTSLGGIFASWELTLLSWAETYFTRIGTPYRWLPNDLMSPVRFPVVCPLEKFSLQMQPDLYFFFFSRFPFNRPFILSGPCLKYGFYFPMSSFSVLL